MQQNLNVQWQDFSVHLKGTLHDMLNTGEFTDVTLVCDDLTELRAHKVILSACSSIFRRMLQGRNNPNSIIFLKGISHINLELILQFIYNGETAFPQANLETFLDVARSLNIKELSDIGVNSQTIEPDGIPLTKEFFGNKDNFNDDSVKEENPNNFIGANTSLLNVTHPAQYYCDVCTNPFFKKADLAKHAKDVHGKPSIYACKKNNCNYVSTERSTLKSHIDSHENKAVSKTTKIERKEDKKAESTVVKAEHKAPKKMFACFLCMYKCDTKVELRNHSLAEHKNDFPIPLPASLPTNEKPSNDSSLSDNNTSAETQESSE